MSKMESFIAVQEHTDGIIGKLDGLLYSVKGNRAQRLYDSTFRILE